MHEFKEGDLHSGKTETIVTNLKQAIPIALSVAESLEKKSRYLNNNLTTVFFINK